MLLLKLRFISLMLNAPIEGFPYATHRENWLESRWPQEEQIETRTGKRHWDVNKLHVRPAYSVQDRQVGLAELA